MICTKQDTYLEMEINFLTQIIVTELLKYLQFFINKVIKLLRGLSHLFNIQHIWELSLSSHYEGGNLIQIRSATLKCHWSKNHLYDCKVLFPIISSTQTSLLIVDNHLYCDTIKNKTPIHSLMLNMIVLILFQTIYTNHPLSDHWSFKKNPEDEKQGLAINDMLQWTPLSPSESWRILS